MPKPDKALEGGPKLEKVYESVLKVQKKCHNLWKCVKSSKSVPKPEKVGKKCAKSWESMPKPEKVC